MVVPKYPIPGDLARLVDAAALWSAICENYSALRVELAPKRQWPTAKGGTATKNKFFRDHALGHIREAWQQSGPGRQCFPWSDDFVRQLWFAADAHFADAELERMGAAPPPAKKGKKKGER
jgi:hypothetical protein